MPTIVLDTLGRLVAHGHGLDGWCHPATPAAERVRSTFDIDMPALLAESGANASIVGLRPPRCPRCGSGRTEIRLRVLSDRAGEVPPR